MPSDMSKSRRARLQLSCQSCRIGKLKCNRELPCEQCIKRSRETQCTYTTGAQESINYKAQAKAMKEKLENLERAIQSFKAVEQSRSAENHDFSQDFAGVYIAKNGTNAAEATITPDNTPPDPASAGQMMTTHNGEAFVGPTHWASIMNDIDDVKAWLDTDDHSYNDLTPSETSARVSSPEALSPPDMYLRTTTMTRDALISSVPQKPVADRLLAAYFGSMDLYKPTVHVPTFQKQYQRFWQNPDSMSTSWLALLFDIFALGFQYTVQARGGAGTSSEKNQFLELAANAIVVADYTRTKPYTVESLLLYIRCCQMQGPERQFRDWLTLGLLCRLSLRMGYHRDPSLYPEMSIFDGEMRRRVWMFVCFMDVTQSYQVGLLSVISGLGSNVTLPRNLYDTDFGPETTELPPSRSPTEWTTMGHSLHKGRLLPLFGEAVKMSHTAVPPPLSAVYEVAGRLQKTVDEIPPPLILVPQDQSLGDSPDLLIKRFGMEILAQKARVVLFRRYLGTREIKARKVCVCAALRCLKVQRLIEEARLPGGPLYNSPAQYFWDLMDSFLLSTIVVGLELKAVGREASIGKPVYSKDEHRVMMGAVLLSCEMWEKCTIASEKAKRASRTLVQTLRPTIAAGAANIGAEAAQMTPGFNFADPPDPVQKPIEAAWHGPANSHYQTFDFNDYPMSDSGQSFVESIQPQMSVDSSVGIDWGMWDSQINQLDEQSELLLDSRFFEAAAAVNPFAPATAE